MVPANAGLAPLINPPAINAVVDAPIASRRTVFEIFTRESYRGFASAGDQFDLCPSEPTDVVRAPRPSSEGRMKRRAVHTATGAGSRQETGPG
ncbi:hypothetical protein [Kribbella flavida]|uniref:hypothetical protein n=1 Tax=Kribbella flavida TaxID=182640 RepID=UPI0011D2C333|nr:hypothetical protein [Kribbella flavida]